MDYEKKYKEALERAKKELSTCGSQDCDAVRQIYRFFPELCESEDERIRKALVQYVKNWKAYYHNKGCVFHLWTSDERECDDILAWLEKQGGNCLVNFDEAEQEKYDFVSGQYIECRASFNEFKEDNSYWLEYIGDDNYIGRSDDILNQKFHITPRQLFTLFTQQHCPKEDSNVNDETNAPTGYGKYVDECLNEASKHFFSEGEDKYSVADLFYAGVRCGKSWFEKQGEKEKDILEDAILDGNEDGLIAETIRYKNENQGEQKPNPCDGCINRKGCINCENGGLRETEHKHADKVEPKFHEGEWITGGQLTCKVLSVTSKSYELHLYNDDYCHFETDIQSVDKHYHLWTIQDAKAGDVLVSQYNKPFIYNGDYDTFHVGSYCGISTDGIFKAATEKCHWTNNVNIHPATKEQRDALMKAIADAGYIFDFEKKELKKIAWSKEELTDFEKSLKHVMEETLECGDIHNLKADADLLLRLVKPTDREMKEALRTEYEKGRADAFAQMRQEWSEEDENVLEDIEEAIINYWHGDTQDILLNWLKERYTWKPSDEQIIVLELASKYERVFTPKQIDILIGLKEQLKELKGE